MTLDYLPWVRPRRFDDLPCIRDEKSEFTYREFARAVDAVAEQFRDRGVSLGSVVAVMLPNRAELLISVVAAWRLGATAMPVNPVFTVTEATYQIQDSNAVLVVNEGPGSADGGRPSIGVGELRREPLGKELVDPAVELEDTALLIYTSGSTGRPKGVMLSHGNIGSMAAMMAEATAVTSEDHCLLVLPLFHVNAICVSYLMPMLVGAQLTVLARFTPGTFLAAVEEYRPTFFSAVPTIYAHLVSQPADAVGDTSSVRFAICGAAPASVELLNEVESRFGFPLLEGYGLTEGTCASTVNPLDGVRKVGTVGPALPGQTVAIMDPSGRLVPTGERGEVVIQGPNVMQGYLNRPEATADALGDGWLHTGDVGILDEDGYLRLVDRIKDMIIRGGENIYPKEIESVLHQHPAVLEAAVVGKSDRVYGEVPVAFVTSYPDAEVGPDDLLALCKQHLTKIKVPTAVHILPELPKNPVGKIDKPALRVLVESGQTPVEGA